MWILKKNSRFKMLVSVVFWTPHCVRETVWTRKDLFWLRVSEAAAPAQLDTALGWSEDRWPSWWEQDTEKSHRREPGPRLTF